MVTGQTLVTSQLEGLCITGYDTMVADADRWLHRAQVCIITIRIPLQVPLAYGSTVDDLRHCTRQARAVLESLLHPPTRASEWRYNVW